MTNEKPLPLINSKKTCLNVVFITYPICFRYDTNRKHSYIVWREGVIKNREFSLQVYFRLFCRLIDDSYENVFPNQKIFLAETSHASMEKKEIIWYLIQLYQFSKETYAKKLQKIHGKRLWSSTFHKDLQFFLFPAT